MLKLFSAFRKEKIWDFDGGIHPPEMKTQSSGTPLRQIPLANRFVIPLKQHIGAEGELCVKVGDTVLRGQPLSLWPRAYASSSCPHIRYRNGDCSAHGSPPFCPV